MVEVIKSNFFMVGISELWIYTFLDRCVVNSYVTCVAKKGTRRCKETFYRLDQVNNNLKVVNNNDDVNAT